VISGGGAGQSAAAVAAAMSSLSDNVVSSSSIVHHQQVWRPIVRPSLRPSLHSPLDPLWSAGHLPLPPTATMLPSVPLYFNLRPDAGGFCSVPRAANIALRGASFQRPPQLPASALRDLGQSDYQHHQHAYQQQQQQQPVSCGHSQLMPLLTRHCQLTQCVFRQMEISLNEVVNDLSLATSQTYIPSPSLCDVCDQLKLVSLEEDSLRQQHRVYYMTAYSVLVAEADPRGLASVSARFVMDNTRTVSTCSVGVDGVTRRLCSGVLSMTSCVTTQAAETTHATLLLHVAELRRYLHVFRESLIAYETHVFCRQPIPTRSGQATLGSGGKMMPDSGTDRQQADVGEEPASDVQKAFNDDVDQLLSDQQQQPQQPVTRDSATYQPVSISTSSVVDEPSNFTRVIDTGVTDDSRMTDPADYKITCTSVVRQTEPLQAASTGGRTGTSAVVKIEPAEVTSSTYQPVSVPTSSVVDGLPNLASLLDTSSRIPDPATTSTLNQPQPPQATWTSVDVTDRRADDDRRHLTTDSTDIQIANAVDLMSLGGFPLFVPFLLPADRQPDESRDVAVTQEHLPPDDVINKHKAEDAGDTSATAVDWVRAADDADDSDQICRAQSIFAVPPDSVEAAETSLLTCALSELPVGENATVEQVPATVDDATPEHHDSVTASVESTARSSTKDVSTDARSKGRQKSPKLTTSEIIRKRKTYDSTNDVSRKKARKVDARVSTSAKPLVAAATKESTWVCQKKLIIPRPPARPMAKRRLAKYRVDTLVTPSPAAPTAAKRREDHNNNDYDCVTSNAGAPMSSHRL